MRAKTLRGAATKKEIEQKEKIIKKIFKKFEDEKVKQNRIKDHENNPEISLKEDKEFVLYEDVDLAVAQIEDNIEFDWMIDTLDCHKDDNHLIFSHLTKR